MIEFGYNNNKTTSTRHMFFELNCNYHLRVFFKEYTNRQSKFKLENKLSNKLKKLIIIC